MKQEATPHGLVSKDSTRRPTAEQVIPLHVRGPGKSDVPPDYEERPWPAARRAALERAEHSCESCGAIEDLHVHHLVYRAHGGGHCAANLMVLCATCHRETHAVDVFEREHHAQVMHELHERRRDALGPHLAVGLFGFRGLE